MQGYLLLQHLPLNMVDDPDKGVQGEISGQEGSKGPGGGGRRLGHVAKGKVVGAEEYAAHSRFPAIYAADNGIQHAESTVAIEAIGLPGASSKTMWNIICKVVLIASVECIWRYGGKGQPCGSGLDFCGGNMRKCMPTNRCLHVCEQL